MTSDIDEIVKLEALTGEVKLISGTDNTVNRVYEVGNNIVRIKQTESPAGEDLGSHKNFINACSLLKNNLIPCPVITTSGTLHDKEYLVYNKLPGVTALSLLKYKTVFDLDSQSLVADAAILLKKLHAIAPLPSDKIDIGNAFEYTQLWLRKQIAIAISESLLETTQEDQILHIMERYCELIKEYDPRFVHMDFHLGNILVVNNKMTGLLDFDRSFLSDCLLDFSSLHRHFNKLSFGREAYALFLKNYFLDSMDTKSLVKIDLYTLFYYVKQLPVAARLFSESTTQEFKIEITRLLNIYAN